VAYAQTGNALEAALYGTVAGSIVVEQRGALGVLPLDRTLANQRLAWLRDSVQLPRTESKQPCAWKTAS
jgi:hypothetical protein